MKSFRTFLIEAEVLQKDKILLFLNKNKDNPRIAKLLKAFKDGKLSERQLDGISDMIKNKKEFEEKRAYKKNTYDYEEFEKNKYDYEELEKEFEKIENQLKRLQVEIDNEKL